MNRISRIRLHIEHARLESRRSTCVKRQVGCVAIRDGRVIATGYNGVLPGVNPRFGIDEHGNTLTVHAEANLIAFAANNGTPLKGSELYITLEPCRKCAELILQAGFSKVYFTESYRDHSGLELLVNSTTQIIKVEPIDNDENHDFKSKLVTKSNYNA